MPTDPRGAALAPPPARPVLRFHYSRLVNAVFALFIFCGAIAFVEPSPYDFVSLIAMPLWFIGGFRISRGVIPFVVLIILYNIAGFIALVPYWNEPDPRTFMLQSLYLAITAIFFVIFFNERTSERVFICLWAFAASTVVAALSGIAGYFDFAGTGEMFATFGRAAGTFKDPNVYGSYMILGALFLFQQAMFGTRRTVIFAGALFLVDMLGIFLSFSRGSWSAFIISATTMIGITFATTRQSSMRRRILIAIACALIAGVLLIIAIMSIDSVHQLFLQRAQAPGEEYDDPRFQNQLRSLPMLLDRPNGFGPLRFRLWFDLEPHSSFVNAFASYGWFGGFMFYALIGLTTFVGFRLTIMRSPFQQLALVVWPALMMMILQGFQIDIDHWRHFYLMLGMLWGMEAARVRWTHRLEPARPTDATAARAEPARSVTKRRPQLAKAALAPALSRQRRGGVLNR